MPGKLHTYCLFLWAKCLIAFLSRKTLFSILPPPLFFQHLHYPFSMYYDSLLTWDHWLRLPPPCPGTPYINRWNCWTKNLKTKQKINMCRFIVAFVFSMHRQINIMEIRSLCSALLSTVQYDKKIPVLCRKKKKRLDKLCYCTITRSWRKRIIKVEHNVNCNQYKDRLRWHWIAEGQHFFCIWRVVGKPVKGFRSLGKLCVFSWTLSYSQCPFHKEEERKLRVFKSHPLFKSTQSRVFVKLTGPYC